MGIISHFECFIGKIAKGVIAMEVSYECQICKHTTNERPPEWCPRCGGHRVIFKRIVRSEELTLASA